ncbi:MAG: outer membrane lipoprotein-sorting protein [Lentisphaeria bacterium]
MMKSKKISREITGLVITTTITALFCFTGLQIQAQEETDNGKEKAENTDLTVEEIVHKSNHAAYYFGDDGRARVKMDIVDGKGRERSRELTILRKDMMPEDQEDEEFIGDQRFYVYFHRPSDVRETVFMVWKHVGDSDDRWLYLPSMDLVNRISSSDKRTSFVGSHFFYEDVSGRGIEEDKQELTETTDNYYVLKNTPKDPSNVEFEYYKMWIHKDTFLPIKTEYYDDDDEKYRSYEVLEVETIDGYPTVVKSRMNNLQSGGKTTMTYENVEYNIGLPDDLFSERYLRRSPRKYLR